MAMAVREAIERREHTILAPYASFSDSSLGRVYPQSEHPLRTCYQRDRDRIVHSAAFRRMEYKTQVFIPHEQDHFRTRLTHTIEVAQISRTVARNLGLNEDLAEAVALVHDVGHTPFGHAGEKVLDRLLKEHGGFNHNRQSLRVVDILEQRYPEHPGLNLTFEVREGIARHETTIQMANEEFARFTQPSMEAALVDLADEVAYNAHDVDDGIASGLISFEQLYEKEFSSVLLEAPEVPLKGLNDDYRRYSLVRHLVNHCTTDLIDESSRRLAELTDRSHQSIRKSTRKIVAYSDELRPCVRGLKEFLNHDLYRHPSLKALSDRATEIIEGIYYRLKEDPALMPRRFQGMLSGEKAEIVIADYVAGMTDRYAENVARKLSVI